MRNTSIYNIFVGNSEGKRSLVSLWPRWKNNGRMTMEL